MNKQRRVQLILISVGLLLFCLTYLLYPSVKKNKIAENKSISENLNQADSSDNSTTFENLEYKGLYNFDKPFKVKSEKAYILNEEPDTVYMKNMRVILYLKDNRTVEITSRKGRYNKANYNCFFEQDVYATDGETKISGGFILIIVARPWWVSQTYFGKWVFPVSTTSTIIIFFV